MAEELRFGVIGIKGRGGRLAKEVAACEGAGVAAVAELDEAAGREAGETFDASVWRDYEEMLAKAELDAAIVATPHHLHGPMGLACLEAGLHTFVEKPIANRVSEGDRLVAAAEERGLKLGIGHNYRTFPGNRAMKKLIDEGALGDLHRVLWMWLDTRTEGYYARDVWRSTWAQAGGGVLMNQTSHDLDLMCWMVGDPVEVSASIGNWAHRFELEDSAAATVRFASGAMGSVQLSICDRPLNFRQLSGDRGTLEYEDTNPNSVMPKRLSLGRYGGSMRELIAGDAGVVSRPEIAWEEVGVPGEAKAPPMMPDFINAIREGRAPVTDGSSALQTLELINGIILSAVEGRTVKMPVDRGAYDRVFEGLCRGEVGWREG